VIDGIRGEPSQPSSQAEGEVWSSIVTFVDRPGEGNRFVRTSDQERAEFATHPMTLGGGRDLRRRLEGIPTSLGDVAESVGVVAISGEDDAFVYPESQPSCSVALPLIIGDGIRDWLAPPIVQTIFPYAQQDLAPLDKAAAVWLWPRRAVLENRQTFARQTYRAAGRAWWSWHQTTLDRLATRLTIVWAFVATHNHFALDRGGHVFGQSVLTVKLAGNASADDYLGLLGVLNSSVACFYLQQVCHNMGAGGGQRVESGRAALAAEAWENHFQFNATKVKNLPIPDHRVVILSAALDRLSAERAALLDDLVSTPLDVPLTDHLTILHAQDRSLSERLVAVQEELDWEVLAAYGLVSDELPGFGLDGPPLAPGQRAFEIVLARQIAAGETGTTWFERHSSTPITEPPTDWPADYRAVIERRIALIESNPDIGLIERPEHKRRWARRPWDDRQREALTSLVLDALEDPGLWSDLRLRSTAELADHLRAQPRIVEALELLADRNDVDVATTVRRLVLGAAVPHLAALRLTDKGLRKRAEWEHVWELQREEDRIDARLDLPENHPERLSSAAADMLKAEQVGTIPVPPRHAQADFRSTVYWKLRGKLDVPKERFTLIPGAERGADTSPVVGWAGWDARDLARALAGRITELREQEAADAERLVPLLAGVLELLPWIHQWHPESEALYGGPPGRYFEDWLDGQLSELTVTRETLRAWRPPAPTRGRRAKATVS